MKGKPDNLLPKSWTKKRRSFDALSLETLIPLMLVCSVLLIANVANLTRKRKATNNE